MRLTKILTLGALLASSLLAGCSEFDQQVAEAFGTRSQTERGAKPVGATIGPGGGSISFAGLTLTIPPGALRQSVTILIGESFNKPSGFEFASRVFNISPVDLQLGAPATIRIAGNGATRTIFLGNIGDSQEFTGLATSGGSTSAFASTTRLGRVFLGRAAPVSSFALYLGDTIVDGRTELFGGRISGDTAAVTTLSFNDAAGSDVVLGAPSPNGKRLVYVGDTETLGKRELFLVDISSTTPSTPVKISGTIVAGGNLNTSNLTWLPDSSGVFYLADANVVGVSDLFFVDLSGASPKAPVLVNSPGLAQGLQLNQFKVAPDGNSLIFSSTPGSPVVFDLFLVKLVNRVPGAPTKINGAYNQTGGSTRFINTISYAPNSQSVAYTSNQDNNAVFDLYLVNLSGPTPAAPARVSDGSGRVDLIDADRRGFSPDSSALVFNQTATTSVLRLSRVSGGVATAPVAISPTTLTSVSTVRFANTGRRLVFQSRNTQSGLHDLFLVDFTGTPNSTKLTPAAPANSNILDFELTANDKVVFRGDYQTDSQIEIFQIDPASPGTLVKISQALIAAGDVSQYHVAGSRVVFSADPTADGVEQIFLSDLSSPTPTAPTRVSRSLLLNELPEFSAQTLSDDGRFLLYSSGTTTRRVFVTDLNAAVPSAGVRELSPTVIPANGNTNKSSFSPNPVSFGKPRK